MVPQPTDPFVLCLTLRKNPPLSRSIPIAGLAERKDRKREYRTRQQSAGVYPVARKAILESCPPRIYSGILVCLSLPVLDTTYRGHKFHIPLLLANEISRRTRSTLCAKTYSRPSLSIDAIFPGCCVLTTSASSMLLRSLRFHPCVA